MRHRRRVSAPWRTVRRAVHHVREPGPIRSGGAGALGRGGKALPEAERCKSHVVAFANGFSGYRCISIPKTIETVLMVP